MATHDLQIQKFCLEYIVRDSCSNPNCQFFHYSRQRVQVITAKSEQGFVEGRLSHVPLCRYYPRGTCRFGHKCRYRHEMNVIMPTTFVPPPTTSNASSSTSLIPQQNDQSKTKSCGICLEIIVDKSDGDRRFGILPNCSHCYCLTCICKWRQSRQFKHKIIKACPECRVTSDFVCPSLMWVEEKTDKERVIDNYKKTLSLRDCRYFRKGAGKCPFGNKCFYRHAFPDGRLIDVGPPSRRRHRRRQRHSHMSTDFEFLQQVILFNVLDDDEEDGLAQWQLAEEFEDLAPFFSDDDVSNDEDSFVWSDMEYMIG